MNRSQSRLGPLLPALFAAFGIVEITHAAEPIAFHETKVLGTSFDLLVTTTNPTDADKVREVMLGEIRRLEKILSAYDADAELAKLNATLNTVAVSPELIEVLSAYEAWSSKTNGAFSGQVASLKSLWADGRTPDDATLAKASSEAREPFWQIDRAAGTVKRLADRPINLDSLGKGFIVDRALVAAKRDGPAVEGMLLNIGGDMVATGFGTPGRKIKWTLSVADPNAAADNARPLVDLRLSEMAVATSGGYARHHHLIDPRTGKPVGLTANGKPDRRGVASVTVVASDNATANALATSICVLGADEGLKLVKETTGAECLIVLNGGGKVRSDGFKRYEIPRGDGVGKSRIAEADGERMSADYIVDVTLPVKPNEQHRGERPYVAIWIEDDQGLHVKTLGVWGNEERWIRQMDHWSRIAKGDPSLIAKVTRATREAGKYQLQWDGTDVEGRKAPQGQYDVWVEVSYEHGTRLGKKARIECGTGPQRIVLDANDAWDTASVDFKAK